MAFSIRSVVGRALPWLRDAPGQDAPVGNRAILGMPPQRVVSASDPLPSNVRPLVAGNEFGASGTENFGGYIRREDYNPELDNFVTAVRIYDKMRMGDAQIRAMLSVIKLPLRGALWTCLPPEGGDSVDQQIADFCNTCIFNDDAMEESWDSTLRHILLQLEFGFCASMDTEVLTRSGWKTQDDVAVGDLVLTLNPETRQSEWQPVLAMNRFPGLHAMRHLKTAAHDSLTTAKHRWLVGRYTKHDSTETEWVTTAGLNTNHVVYRGAVCSDLPTTKTFTDEFVELVGWFTTEGQWVDACAAVWQKNLAQRAQIEGCLAAGYGPAVESLRDVPGAGGRRTADVGGWRVDEREDGCARYSLNAVVAAQLRAVCDDEKAVSLEFVLALTADQLRLFVDTVMAGDGSVSAAGERVFAQAVPSRLDAVELAATLLGDAVNRWQRDVTRSYDGQPTVQYGLTLCSRVEHRPVAAARRSEGGEDDWVIIDGAWCPTTPNGTWYARRNGKPFMTGNSVLEKVWRVDDEGVYRLARLAPRLPKTIRMWHVDRNGKLLSVVQYAPVPISTSYASAVGGSRGYGAMRGGVRDVPLSGVAPGIATPNNPQVADVHYATAVMFQYLVIPAEYLAVFSLDREGDNYQGRSILRSVYRNFYFKDQAYHLEGVRLDRWGVGIPVAILEEGHTLNQQDLDALVEVLTAVRANERAYLIAPPHVSFDLLPKTGSQTAGSGASAWIDHHDTQIARNVLAGFLTMGSDAHGTLGFGARLTDMFISSLNGVAAGICADMKRQVVKPLCFLPTARVTLADGTRKPISDVVTGDRVIGHDGQPHAVVQTMVRDYDGPMAEIHAVGHEPMVCTPEHPLFVAPERPLFMQRGRYVDTQAVESDARYQYAGRGVTVAAPAIVRTWKEAASVRRGEYLLSPVVAGESAPAPSAELCTVMGWFLAEGCYIKPSAGEGQVYKGLQFTLGASDEARGFVDDLTSALETCGIALRPTQRPTGRNSVVVTTRPCEDVVEMLRRECGEYSHGKHLPSGALFWPLDRKRALLAAYWHGDGMFWESDAGYLHGFAVTRSRQLAEGLVALIESLGISCRLKTRPARGRSKECWDVSVAGSHCFALQQFFETGAVPDTGKRLHQKSFCVDGYHHYRVKAVTQRPYRGSVFNLEVADVHTYVVEGLVAHNCDLNFDMTKRKYPRVTVRDLERVDLKNLVDTLSTLGKGGGGGGAKKGEGAPPGGGTAPPGSPEEARAGWLTPDDATEALLRKLLDLPMLDDAETRKGKKDAPAAPAAPGPVTPEAPAAVTPAAPTAVTPEAPRSGSETPANASVSSQSASEPMRMGRWI